MSATTVRMVGLVLSVLVLTVTAASVVQASGTVVPPPEGRPAFCGSHLFDREDLLKPPFTTRSLAVKQTGLAVAQYIPV